MGILKDLFDDVVDIAISPVKVAAKLVDTVADSELEDFVDEVKDSIKSKEE